MSQKVLFIGYSHKDRRELERLLLYLKPLIRHQSVHLWDDKQINPRAYWKQELEHVLSRAQMAILVVTQSFLDSDLALDHEIPAFLEARKHEGLTLIPVIAGACAWRQVPWLASANVIPRSGESIWDAPNVVENLFFIAREVEGFFSAAPLTSQAASNAIAETARDSEDTVNFEDDVVPWFFQSESESALKAQVDWLRDKLGLDDHFFAKLLKMGVEEFFEWRTGANEISEEMKDYLKEFWHMVLHLLSYLSFNFELVRKMLLSRDEREERAVRLPFDTPWAGTSIKEYLETAGPAGISEVSRWVLSFRFADRHQIDTENIVCS